MRDEKGSDHLDLREAFCLHKGILKICAIYALFP